tara:strand:+ start:3159 stop:4265 length:1107 start_codon:yes stop_codon:yes gene_type:complete
MFKIKNYKIILRKKFSIPKAKPSKDLKSFYGTVLSGICLIIFFSVVPIIEDFGSSIFIKSQVVENNSKKIFKNTLEGKTYDVGNDLDTQLNIKNLFDDIFDINENSPTDVVRLNASTLDQLFKDTNYNLKSIRKNKVVKPIEINLLPSELKQFESSKKKKDLFIKIVLPLILEENNSVKIDRKMLFSILNKNNNTRKEKLWLEKKFQQYGIVDKDLSTLKIRMDVVPVSIAIAQAAKETGWGTSRFAIQGNALFGQWTWSGEGIKPAAADSDTKHKVMKFKVLRASVRAYLRNLNTHSSYRNFRKERAIQRDNYSKLMSLELVDFLDQYAETGKEYTKVLKKIIEQNSLTDFDDAKILPRSKKIKNVI